MVFRLLAFDLISRRRLITNTAHEWYYLLTYKQPTTTTHLFQVHVFHETFSRSLEVRQFCLTNSKTSSSVRGFTGKR